MGVTSFRIPCNLLHENAFLSGNITARGKIKRDKIQTIRVFSPEMGKYLVLFRDFCSAVGYFGIIFRVLFLSKCTHLYKSPGVSTASLTKTPAGLPRFSGSVRCSVSTDDVTCRLVERATPTRPYCTRTHRPVAALQSGRFIHGIAHGAGVKTQ